MNKIITVFIIQYFVLMYAVCDLYSAFENTFSGARPYGMGNAYTAISDDVQGIFYNPAGLSEVRHGELITYYGKPFIGLDDKSNISESFLAYLHPLRGRESFAISLSDFRVMSAYSENIAALSYSKDISRKLSLGTNFKVLKIKYGSDSYTEIDPVFNRKSRTSFSSDIGLFIRAAKKFSIGFAAFNLNEPNVGLNELVLLPIRVRLGFSTRAKIGSLCFDIEKQRKQYLRYMIGAEKSYFKDKFFMREGIEYTTDYLGVALGLSFLPDPLKIDYAFQLPLMGIKDIMGSHRISIVFLFGKELNDPFTKDLEEKIANLEEEKQGLQENLKVSEENYTTTSTEAEKIKIQLDEIQKQKEQLELEKRRLEYRPPPKKITYHLVEKGDTLKSVSQKYYGTPDRWQDVYNANKNKIERGMPVVGERLIIP